MVDANLQRYLEIMKSVEAMIEEHRRKALKGVPEHSRLHRIVPSVATFFTSLPLEAAFLDANAKHSIAARRFVPPSFNDIRRYSADTRMDHCMIFYHLYTSNTRVSTFCVAGS